jgi:hypothetical protein
MGVVWLAAGIYISGLCQLLFYTKEVKIYFDTQHAFWFRLMI